MKHTLKTRLEAGLQALGFFCGPRTQHGWGHVEYPGQRIYVGKNGGLRRGRCRSQSHSIGGPSNQTPFYCLCLTMGDDQLAVTTILWHAAPAITALALSNE